MPPYSAVVLGGGVSGLTAAYYLCRMGRKVALVEGSPRLGGWLQTIRHGDGIVYETGPRSIRPVGPTSNATCLLLEDLMLENQVKQVLKKDPAAQNRMILLDHQLHSIPTGIQGIFLPTKPFGKPLIATAFQELFRPGVEKTLTDDSIYEFAKRRFGKKVAENGVDPLIRGITAGDCREISVVSMMEPFFQGEKNHGSVIKSMFMKKPAPSDPPKYSTEWSKIHATAQKRKWAIYSLENGIETLTERLKEELYRLNCKIYSGAPVKSLEFRQGRNHACLATIDLGFEKLDARHVVSTIPAFALAPLLEKDVPVDFLRNMPFVDVAVVNLEFTGQDLLQKKAFGYLVPSHQTYSSVLGVVFDTCSFPQKDKTIMTVMMGGRWFKDLFGDDPNEDHLLSVALEEVKQRMGIKKAPERFYVSVLKKCIPQHIVGHKEELRRFREAIAYKNLPLTLAGASYDGISVNDCVHYAKKHVMSLNLSD